MPAAVLLLVAASFLLGLGAGALWVWSRFLDDRRELAWYRRTFVRHKGRSPLTGGAYDVFSADGGETWRNVEDIGEGKMIVRGPADEKLVEWLRLEGGAYDPARGPSLWPVSLLEERARRRPQEPKE